MYGHARLHSSTPGVWDGGLVYVDEVEWLLLERTNTSLACLTAAAAVRYASQQLEFIFGDFQEPVPALSMLLFLECPASPHSHLT